MFSQRLSLALAFACCAVCGSAKADWSDNFNGGLQQTWNFGGFDGNLSPSASFQAGSVGDVLVLTDSNTVAGGGSALGIGWVNQQFSNVTVTGTINPLSQSNLNGFVGLLARADLSTLSGYVFTYNPITGSVDLVRAVNGNQTGLADTTIAAQTDSLFANLTVFGDQVTGRLFDAPGGNLLAEVTAVDTTFNAGVSGVVVQINDNAFFTPLRGTWDNVSSVTAIPEPATTLLLGLMGLTVVIRRRMVGITATRNGRTE